MKRGTKRLLIFQIILFIILILNSFISNILSEYRMVIFLGLSLVAFYFFLGLEKDKHVNAKEVIFEIVVFLIIFLMAYYLLGIIIGFAKAGDYYNFKGFKDFILPIIFTVALKEVLRYNMLMKAEKNKWLFVTTCLIFILIDITNPIYFGSFKEKYDVFIFIALTFLPSICTNIMCTYLTLKAGYQPVIVYLCIMGLYRYLIPIVPNPNEYITSIVYLTVPATLLYKMYHYFKKRADEDIPRNYNKNTYVGFVISLIVVVVSVYFTSGYFKYHAVAIATGSMHPTIKKGDVVVIEKYRSDYERLEVGDVLAFKYNGILIVHRIIRIVPKDDTYYFYTQGDANNTEDGYPVTEKMVEGEVKAKIPYIGLITVWLKEL